MRSLFSASAVALCLVVLPSCSSSNLTKADLAAFKLRDLTRFGQPHIVKVSREEIEELEEAELRSGQVASLSRKHQARIPASYHAPVDYVPPSLPDNAVGFDGSILPPKTAGGSAVLDIRGAVPGQHYVVPSYPTSPPQSFSIE